MRTRNYLVIIIALLTFSGCSNEEVPKPVYVGSGGVPGITVSDPDLTNTTFNVLFVGNSLTYTNNLPEIFKEKASEKGLDVGITMVALPNYAISDHWASGAVQDFISSKQYDYVVVQQGPSSQPPGRQILIDYGKLYSDLCEANNAQLCFFMVWPALTWYQTFDGVIKNYTEAAELYDALLAPVGEVWKTHIENTGDRSYYGNDGFHPSLLGSTVAAEIILETLTETEEDGEPTKNNGG